MSDALFLDSCAHPTCDGQWTTGRTGVTHAELASDLRSSGWQGALSIGLPGVGAYEHHRFMELCLPHPELIPVAGLTTHHIGPALDADLEEIQECGYRIVKIHPRLLGYEHTLAALPSLIGECVTRGLAVALCTYPEYRSVIEPDDARRQMARAMAGHPEAHFITMHTGVLDPSPFAALAAENPRILLDFSLSLPKYADVVQEKLIDATHTAPGAVSLGSDGPEWTYEQIRESFEAISPHLPASVARGLAGANLQRWLDEVDPSLTSARK